MALGPIAPEIDLRFNLQCYASHGEGPLSDLSSATLT